MWEHICDISNRRKSYIRETHLKRAPQAELSNKVQQLKELYEKALDDIQSKDEQTEVSRCLLEETMETPQCQEKAVNKAGEVPGSGSKGCHAQAGNPGLGHEKTGTQWMPKV